MRVEPEKRALKIVDAFGRDFRASKRQAAERIRDAGEATTSGLYWQDVLFFIQQLERGRSLRDRRCQPPSARLAQ
jgi:hypothetical protein